MIDDRKPSCIAYHAHDGYMLAIASPDDVARVVWVVLVKHSDAVMHELINAWKGKQSMSDAIQRLGLMGLHPSNLLSNVEGSAIVAAAGVRMNAGLYANGCVDGQ